MFFFTESISELSLIAQKTAFLSFFIEPFRTYFIDKHFISEIILFVFLNKRIQNTLYPLFGIYDIFVLFLWQRTRQKKNKNSNQTGIYYLHNYLEFNDFIKLLLLVYCIRLKLPFSKFLMFARGYSFVKKNGRYMMSIYVLLLLGFDTIKLIWFFPICKTYTGL